MAAKKSGRVKRELAKAVVRYEHESDIEEGDYVRKVDGYPWPGKVVAMFDTIEGRRRCVVECTASGVRGALHIYSPLQLRKVRMHKAVRVSHTKKVEHVNTSRNKVGTEDPDS